jgi:hypothetical protein
LEKDDDDDDDDDDEKQQHKNNIVLHYFTQDERYLNTSYMHKYLSLFADDVRIQPISKLSDLTLRTKRRNLILGLSDITTDHYNYENVGPELWKGFRDFLMRGMNVMTTTETNKNNRNMQQQQQEKQQSTTTTG